MFPIICTDPRREAWRRSALLCLPKLRAFAGGFAGGLLGGVVYCLILAHFHSQVLGFAWLSVLALSMTFGGFEMWRVARKRKPNTVITCMLWTLAASIVMLWALGAAIPSTNKSSYGTTRHFEQARLWLI
jgi:predicted lipid-binding transport protein (Tim44 family)